MRVEYHFEKVNLVFWKRENRFEKRFPIYSNLLSNNHILSYSGWAPCPVSPDLAKNYLFLHIMSRNFTNFSNLAASTWVSIVFWIIFSVFKIFKLKILKILKISKINFEKKNSRKFSFMPVSKTILKLQFVFELTLINYLNQYGPETVRRTMITEQFHLLTVWSLMSISLVYKKIRCTWRISD